MKNFLAALLCFMSMVLYGQGQVIHNFIFGHSLIDHRPPAIPTPSNETTVPHWIYLLAEAAGNEYAAGGQYGFLPQHQNVPPISQWGYDIVPGVWESDTEAFDQTQINTIFITAGNFIQYQAPTEAYYNDPETSPVSATEKIIDFVGDRDIYIYENWPDMAGFIEGELFPPSQQEFNDYNVYTEGAFHDWWIDYQDALIISRPAQNIKMIPVGPVLSLLNKDLLSEIDILDLYEDNAPHGRPNIYFLAGLISYMSIYEEKAPADFEVPDILSPEIKDNYEEVVDEIWSYLLDFNLPDGTSRVFNQKASNVSDTKTDERFFISPSPTADFISIHSKNSFDRILIYDYLGRMIKTQGLQLDDRLDVTDLPSGFYGLSLFNKSHKLGSRTFIKQ